MENQKSIDMLQAKFEMMQELYKANPYPSYKQRQRLLKTLKKSLIKNEKAIYVALKKDYGYRSDFDTLIADILPSLSLANYSLKNLKKWMKPSKRHSGLLLAPSKVKVYYQPLGVVGVITPWNFPIFLALGPAIQALAAGNKVMIKMSEFTPHTNAVLKKIVAEVSQDIIIIEGEAGIGAAFAKLPFDHLIFTGSTTVGKLVATSAAQNLTPITLELGGKSPTIIAKDVNLNSSIDALIVGKSTNSGQICVAPDYVFVHESKQEEFIAKFIKRYQKYHIKKSAKNTQTHIINDKQNSRLHAFLEDAISKGANIHPVKEYDEKDGKLIYPHLITNVNEDMLAMKEEIFGSILPIKTYKDIDEVISYINSKPRPLALYIMSSSENLIKKVLKNTHSGGVSINDTAMHVMADDAPFGGIGNSGIGHYHGYEGFLTFSKAKTVLYSYDWLPKNSLILRNRDLVFKVLRKFFLK